MSADTGLPNLSTATLVASSTSIPASTSTTQSATQSVTPTQSASSRSTIVITGGVSATGSQTVPVITGGSTATSGGLPTGLPRLPGQFDIPVASVPPTADAPFMQTSTMPEGTVFIAVGAILGFLAILVLAWRGLIAWSLHRSVKRAATHQNMSDSKALFRTPAVPLYKYSDNEPSVSMTNLNGKGAKKNKFSTSGPGTANASSLFYSPTAGAAGTGGHQGNRGSSYLPAGYYAAGASAPGNGAGLAHIGTGNGLSLSNLVPQSQGYSRTRSFEPSPPDSPALHSHRGHPSTSTLTLDLNQRPVGRAPSAYLDDLFDDTSSAPGPVSNQGSGSRN